MACTDLIVSISVISIWLQQFIDTSIILFCIADVGNYNSSQFQLPSLSLLPAVCYDRAIGVLMK